MNLIWDVQVRWFQMSTPTHRKPQSSSSWSLKQCLKVAIAFVALTHVPIAQACRPATIKVTYEEHWDEFCYRKACKTTHLMVGQMTLTVRGKYDKTFYYQTADGKNNWTKIGEQCSEDGEFCITFRGDNDATLHYANRLFKLGKPSVSKGTRTLGSAEYWNCLPV
ncbi:hypothetical protein DFQ26_004667 [Actinomortierella ambigua]|nr:hypothetical protein DFQ26_004667 [Actinomortierella ambigua]